jgi:photosystem II stability/assembly factor-like uncharacterized protein
MNDYLDQVEAQLAELTEHGAHRRLRARRPGLGGAPRPPGSRPPRRRSEALAFLAAAAVAVAVVAIVVLNVGTGKPDRTSAAAAAAGRTSSTATTAQSTHSLTETLSVSPSPKPPLPAQFSPQSFTAISELTWWLLGSEPCSPAAQAPCAGILQTTDGGRTFTATKAPAAAFSNSGVGTTGYSQLRFADGENGFAYAPDLYATHDGGTTWHPVDVGGDVIDLAISDGEVYAIVSPTGSDSGRLMRSPVGQDQWTPVAAAGEVSGGLWVLGTEVIVQSGSGGGYGSDLLVSQNGGESFSRQPAPSPGLPCDFQAQSPQTIWAQCATGTESGVWYSHDYVTGFATAHGSGLPPLPNSAVFGAASDTTAVVGYQQLYRTSDTGRTWTPTGPSGIAQWTYIGFTDSTHGVALGYVGSIAQANQRLYYTTDGGQTYHPVPLP